MRALDACSGCVGGREDVCVRDACESRDLSFFSTRIAERNLLSGIGDGEGGVGHGEVGWVGV